MLFMLGGNDPALRQGGGRKQEMLWQKCRLIGRPLRTKQLLAYSVFLLLAARLFLGFPSSLEDSAN